MMADVCDHASEDEFCLGGCGTFTPTGTDLTLCRRHYNRWRREQGKQVRRTVRPRDDRGEAIPGGDPVPVSEAPWRDG